MVSDTILTLIIASSSAIIALALKLCYSSKCRHIKCCGNVIDRDTQIETRITFDGARSPQI